jgi:hypothetical protein
MSLKYSVKEQTYVNGKNTHSGKLISAIEEQELLGQTGYLDWNIQDYENDKNTARLKRAHSCVGIIVHKERVGIGSELMERLFDELISDDFDQLVIPRALFFSKGFYDKVIQRLKERDKILSYEVDVTVYPSHSYSTYPSLDQILIKYDILLKT